MPSSTYYAVLLALVLGVGCGGSKEAIMVGPDGELVDQGNLSHHHGPPLVEMLPPIGPIGIVAIVVVADMNYFSPDDAVLAKKPKPATAKTVKELTLREKTIGTYEIKEDGNVRRLVLLENGICEVYENGEKEDGESKWKIVDGEIHVEIGDFGLLVLRINKDGSITIIARIDADGKREEAPKDKQMTLKKIK